MLGPTRDWLRLIKSCLEAKRESIESRNSSRLEQRRFFGFLLEIELGITQQTGVPIRRATQKSDSSRFRVSGFGFRVSGFGFRRLKPTFAVGFGFRVSSIETHFRCRFRISGFGFRPLKPTFAVGFGFRVSGFVAWNQLSLSVSGFGFRVSGFVAWNQLSLSVSGFGFRVSGFVAWNALSLSVSGFGFRVSSIEANFSCPFRVSGFGFRRSKPPLDSPVRCRSHITQVSFSMQSSKTRAVSDKRLKRSERKNGNGLGETCQHP